tara:strand:+ start:155 stop:352 length:198 start_codon:yes stop_codon:yes gene_type:complete
MKLKVMLHKKGDSPMAIDVVKFFEINNFQSLEQRDMLITLLSFGIIHGGGGASPEWTLEVKEDKS